MTRLDPLPDGYGPPPRTRPLYADWFQRVGASLLDSLLTSLFVLPGVVVASFGTVTEHTTKGRVELGVHYPDQTTTEWDALTTIGVVLMYLLPFVFFVWNTCVRQGRIGYSVGKQVLRIRLVKLADGRPVGGWLAFGRYLLHVVDAAVCYLGYLWPLWDRKRQTFSDKIVETVVVNPDQPPRRFGRLTLQR